MAAKPKLSKSILEMKFMKRTKEKVEKELEIEETQKLYKQNLNKNMLDSGESKYYIEPSYFLCEGLREGRLSFRGMNEELEKHLEKTNYWGTRQVGPFKQEVEVEDVEMAEQYKGRNNFARGGHSGRGNHHNRFNQNNKGRGGSQKHHQSQHRKKDNRDGGPPPNKKTKFLKPVEDE